MLADGDRLISVRGRRKIVKLNTKKISKTVQVKLNYKQTCYCDMDISNIVLYIDQ